MAKPLSLRQIIEHNRRAWQKLPDYRQPNNNTRYEIVDAALAAFSVFFMQSPSFLAHQRDMQQQKSRSNARTLVWAGEDTQRQSNPKFARPDHPRPFPYRF